jgi:amino acid transporter
MQKNKISLFTATLICINAVLGGGIFVNPTPLTQYAGSWGFAGYLLAGIILLPLIITLSELARLHPVSGGLYVYSKEYLGSGLGFLSGWSYFLARTCSPALLIHFFVIFSQSTFPALQAYPTLLLDYTLITFFIAINILGVHIGGPLQILISILKMIPIGFIIFVSFWLAPPLQASPDTFNITTVTNIIPIALYALIGFEIICSVGGMVQNPKKNIRRALLISFGIVVSIATLFQFSIFRVLQHDLAHIKAPVLGYAQAIFPLNPMFAIILNTLAFISVVFGGFSLLAGNCWNLATLAKNGHFPFAKTLTKVNKHQAPWVSLLIEGAISCLVLAITKQQVPLQNVIVFALFISYTLSSIALLKAIHTGDVIISKMIPLCSIILCLFIVGLTFKNLLTYGISLPFIIIFLAGCSLSYIKKKKYIISQ